MRSHRRHPRFAVGAGTNALHTAGAPDHFLRECEALAAINRLFGLSKKIAFPKPQSFSCLDGQPATDNQVDSASSLYFVEQNLGFKGEFREHITSLIENFPLIRSYLDDVSHPQVVDRSLEYESAGIFHGVVENWRDLAPNTHSPRAFIGHTRHIFTEEPQDGVGRRLS